MTDKQILRLLGRRVRAARLKAELTQECLAELVGGHWRTIGQIERGSYPIAVTTFARLSQYLDISPNRLLEGLDSPDRQRTARIKKALARKRDSQGRKRQPECQVQKLGRSFLATVLPRRPLPLF